MKPEFCACFDRFLSFLSNVYIIKYEGRISWTSINFRRKKYIDRMKMMILANPFHSFIKIHLFWFWNLYHWFEICLFDFEIKEICRWFVNPKLFSRSTTTLEPITPTRLVNHIFFFVKFNQNVINVFYPLLKMMVKVVSVNMKNGTLKIVFLAISRSVN